MGHLAVTSRFVSLRALGYPAYRRLWVGALVSNVGGWIQTVSIGIYATETTGKAAWTGVMAAMGYLPAVVLGPVGGALADRFDRRRYLALLIGVQVLVASALAVLGLLGRLDVTVLAALVFLSGCLSALGNPAFNALLVAQVESEDLLSAVSLTSGQFNLARMIGPVLATGALALGGLKVAFLANALSFTGVLVALAWTPGQRRAAAAAAEGVWLDIVQGLRVVRQDRGIRLALFLVLMVTLFIAPFIGLIPAYAIKEFGRGTGATSLMVTSQGAGALAGALLANAVGARWGVKNLMRWSLLAVSPLVACYWMAPTWAMATLLLVPVGGVYLWTMSSLSTTCMARVSRGLQARMSSLYGVTTSGGYAVGLFCQGWLADRLGLRVVPAVAAALMLVVVLLLWRRAAYDSVEAPSAFGGVMKPPASGAAMSAAPGSV